MPKFVERDPSQLYLLPRHSRLGAGKTIWRISFWKLWSGFR